MAMADDRASGRGETERQFASAQNIELAADAENLRSLRITAAPFIAAIQNSHARVLKGAIAL